MKNKPILIILFIALVIRILAALYLGNQVTGLSGAHDEISYSMLGQRFAEGHGLTFPSGWYPWIKPDAPQSYYSASMSLLLGVLYITFGYQPLIARLIFALLSTITLGFVYLLTLRIFNKQVALVGAIIATFYAYLIFYGATLLTETPFLLSLVISIYLAYDLAETPKFWKWLALGLCLAICVLFRMAVIFFIPFLLLWIILKNKQKIAYLCIPILMIALALAPFTYRNYQLWGKFMLLEAQFGHVFWNGNHPDSQGDFHPYRVFPIQSEILTSQNDAIITSELLALGIKNVLNDPLLFVKLTITRLREFFLFWPTSDSNLLANLMRVGSFGITLPFMLIGLWLARAEWPKFAPIFLFMLIHTAIYSVSWTMIRYRIPLDVFLIQFAAYALIRFWDIFKGRRKANPMLPLSA